MSEVTGESNDGRDVELTNVSVVPPSEKSGTVNDAFQPQDEPVDSPQVKQSKSSRF